MTSGIQVPRETSPEQHLAAVMLYTSLQDAKSDNKRSADALEFLRSSRADMWLMLVTPYGRSIDSHDRCRDGGRLMMAHYFAAVRVAADLWEFRRYPMPQLIEKWRYRNG